MTVLISALTSICVTLFLFLFQPWLKKWWTTRWLSMRASGLHGRHVNLTVSNGSMFNIMQASLYITINHELSDLCGPAGDDVELYHNPHAPAYIVECQLCWNARDPGKELPPKLDLHSMERQSFSPFYLHEGSIEVASESGWDRNKRKDHPNSDFVRKSRANLTKKHYTGIIKVVSAETFGKEFKFELRPEDKENPLILRSL